MKQRRFGPGPQVVSEVGLGCWQLGADWGNVSEEDALATLHAAADAGITFFDTADVYGHGRSETLIGRFLRQRSGPFFVATKLGRYPEPGGFANFSPPVMRQHVEASLQRLGVERLDLVQLHCLPTQVLQEGAVFETLRELQKAGKIARFGASVESAEEAKLCMAQPGLASLQVIFNIFRQTPLTYFPEAQAKGVAIIVRLPLASGLLAGKYTATTTFPADDHRSYNRDGQKFNVGETFAGLTFERGLQLVEQLRDMLPEGTNLAAFALRWCLDHPAVTVIIPGARNPDQARANAAASELPEIPPEVHQKLADFYRDSVASSIRGPD
jgi:aryl-alcohol dehydrogenase-like predicted oxidoreductase